MSKARMVASKQQSRQIIAEMNAGRIEISAAIEKMRELGLFVEASRIGRYQRVREQG
jgi:biotin operon repressor